MKRKWIVAFLLIVLYCLVLKYMFHVILPFVLAIICYYVMKPLIDYLERCFHVHRSAIGVSLLLVIYLLFAVLLGGIITYLILFLADFFKNIPFYYNETILPFFNQFIDWCYHQFPILMTQDYLYTIQELIRQYIFQLMSFFSSFITHIPTYLFTFFLFIISTFFLVLEYDTLKQKIVSISSHQFIQSLILIKDQCLKSLKIYMKCQFLLMCICFIILTLGFIIMKIKNPIICASLTAALDSLPFIGVGIVLLPVCVIYMFQGAYLRAFYIFLIYLIINVTRSLLEPQIMNKQTKIPSFLLLFSMVIHLYFFGFIGVILSPIHMSLIYSFLDYQEER